MLDLADFVEVVAQILLLCAVVEAVLLHQALQWAWLVAWLAAQMDLWFRFDDSERSRGIDYWDLLKRYEVLGVLLVYGSVA